MMSITESIKFMICEAGFLAVMFLAPGCIAEQSSGLQSSSKAMATIKKLGGTIKVDETQPGKPIDLVNLSNTKITDLLVLEGFTTVTRIQLGGTPILGLSPLRNLSQLKQLDLDHTEVSDLSPLAGLKKLMVLQLGNTQVRDLAPLRNLTNLLRLDLSHTQIHDASLKDIEGLTRLETLSIENTRITDAGLIHLKGLTQLRRLVLRNTQVTNTGLIHLQSLTNLRELDVEGTRITAQGLVLRAAYSIGNTVEAGFPSPSNLKLTFNESKATSDVSMADKAIFNVRAIFETIPGMIGHHAATITAFPDGELLAAWYSYPGTDELTGSAIYMTRRAAGSNQWQTPHLHIDRDVGDGNPVLYSQGDAVWLFQAVVPFGWSTAHIEMQRSSDRGYTWRSPVEIAGPLGANTRFAPLKLPNGSLLLPAYDDLLKRSLFFSSLDGEHWTLLSIVASFGDHHPIQPSITVLDDGRLLAVMRNTGQDWLWVMASDDNGRHWSKPIDSGFPNPASPAALLNLRSGHLILIFNDHVRERRPLSVSLSMDEGFTWTHPKILAGGESTYDYPAAVQSADGKIHILYTLGRRTIQHITLNESWIVQP